MLTNYMIVNFKKMLENFNFLMVSCTVFILNAQ